MIVVVNDAWQKNYRYERTAPVGKKYAPDFKPELTPQQMLELGVFGGQYFADKPAEFPTSWWKKAKLSAAKNPALNYFGVDASQPYSVWVAKGWIHPDDPRGWFQWYCRYYLGRRHEDDARQIKRWKMIFRHVAQIKKNCLPHDLSCRRKQRQALLHWAVDSRKL